LNEYVLVSQDRRRVEVFARTAAGAWGHHAYVSGEDFVLSSVNVLHSVDELYAAAGITMP
jgi:hypothetical protein